MSDYRLILASASPRRRQMLADMGYVFEAMAADIDESCREGELPDAYVLRVAYDKAEEVARRIDYDYIISSDTAVVANGEILGKPKDKTDATRMLTELSGNVHHVLTSVVLYGRKSTNHCVIKTKVEFACLTPEDISAYCATAEPYDKAGAYGIQGQAARFVRCINGSYSAVVGLPLLETTELLAQAGIKGCFTR